MFIQQTNPYQRPAEQPTRLPGESMFELYLRIDPVVILSGNKGRWAVFEAKNAATLMREFARCGREDVRIRGVVCNLGALHPRSLRALNCFLRHSGGLRLFAKSTKYGNIAHRFAWYEFQQYLGLRWVG